MIFWYLCFYTIPLDKDGDIDNFVTSKDIRKVSTISKPRKSSAGNCQVIVETKEVAYERFYEENKVQILDSKLRSHKKSAEEDHTTNEKSSKPGR